MDESLKQATVAGMYDLPHAQHTTVIPIPHQRMHVLVCVCRPQVHVMDEGRRCVVGQAAHGLSLVASQVLRPGKVQTSRSFESPGGV
jgi:hypothetical protein